MKKIDLNTIKELEENCLLELSKEEELLILETANSILNKFEKVTSINTEGIEPLYYPFDVENKYLREDNDFYNLSKEDVLKNAPEKNNDYLIIKKVIK